MIYASLEGFLKYGIISLSIIRTLFVSVVLSDFVWGCLSKSEMSEWSIVVGVSTVVAPVSFVLNVILGDLVW